MGCNSSKAATPAATMSEKVWTLDGAREFELPTPPLDLTYYMWYHLLGGVPHLMVLESNLIQRKFSERLPNIILECTFTTKSNYSSNLQNFGSRC